MDRKRSLSRPRDAEDLLWLRLKALSERGWHFHKASPYRTFILPFVEHEALLVVELEDIDNDRSPVRDRLLREAGYTVLRFHRSEDPASITATVCSVLEDRAR